MATVTKKPFTKIDRNLKHKVVNCVLRGVKTYPQIAAHYGISERSVENIMAAWRARRDQPNETYRSVPGGIRCPGCKGLVVRLPCLLCKVRREMGVSDI